MTDQYDYGNSTLIKVGNEWQVDTSKTTGETANCKRAFVKLCNLNTVYWDWWYPNYYERPYHVSVQDDMKKAFKIAKRLMDNKLIECKTVNKFIDLVNIIVSEIE